MLNIFMKKNLKKLNKISFAKLSFFSSSLFIYFVFLLYVLLEEDFLFNLTKILVKVFVLFLFFLLFFASLRIRNNLSRRYLLIASSVGFFGKMLDLYFVINNNNFIELSPLSLDGAFVYLSRLVFVWFGTKSFLVGEKKC